MSILVSFQIISDIFPDIYHFDMSSPDIFVNRGREKVVSKDLRLLVPKL
jgi:hypothetical protein